MRFVGVVMVFLCCVGGGMRLSGQLAARVKQLDAAERLLTDIIGMVHNQNLPTFEIISHLKQDGYPLGESGSAAEALSTFASSSAFRPEERAILIRAGQLLGTSDRESQSARLELERQSLARLLEAAVRDLEVRGKLFRTAGFLLGALVTVLAI